jgi:hypothetical protein
LKKIVTLLTLLLISVSLKAHIYDPVKWSFSSKRISRTEAMVYFTAAIQPEWHIYSQKVIQDGPIGTSFKFNPSSTYQLSGKTIEPKSISKYEKVFSAYVNYFENKVTFQQKVKLISTSPNVKGTLEYMACTNTKCLSAVELDFSVQIK